MRCVVFWGSLAGGLLLGSACVPSQTITVTSTADSGNESLRAAIRKANTSSSSVTIEIGPGDYALTRCGPDDAGAVGDLDVTTSNALTLKATGTGPVTIRQTCAGERVLDVHAASVLTLQGVTLTGGSVVSNAAGSAATGGGVRARGDVVLDHATITANSVTGAAGDPGNGGAAYGGGLYVEGSLVAANSVISSNTATGGAGAGNAAGGGAYVLGTTTVDAGTFESNRAVGNLGATVHGGALASGGQGSIAASTFSTNAAISGTAAECNGSLGLCSGNAPASGGAIWSASALSLTGSNFSANQASVAGRGDLDGIGRGGAVASDVAITVNGGDFSGNQVSYGSGGALNGIAISITDATFTNNSASGSGGAIAAETLSAVHVTASQNTANGSGGGAIAVTRDATLQRSNIHDNTVTSRQASLRALPPAVTFAGGGAIRVIGKLTISETQVIGNTGSASINFGYAGTFGSPFVGGGIEAGSLDGDSITVANNQALGPSFPSYNIGPSGPSGGAGIASKGSVTLVNATLVGNATAAFVPNTPAVPPFGAAVLAASLTLDQVTIADNANAPAIQAGELTAYRSVATAPAEQPACGRYPDPATGPRYALLASDYNWFDDTSCALTGANDHQTDAAFALGPLADNGGSVPTSAPDPTSVLVDQIPSSACPIPRDARGVTRPQGPACDIGAVEVVR